MAIESVVDYLVGAVGQMASAVLLPLPFFILLAVVVKRRRVLADFFRAVPEYRVNLGILVFNGLLIAPVLAMVYAALSRLINGGDLLLVSPAFWEQHSPILVCVAAIFLGDFVGYWRHRIEHTSLFWPAHTVHHSDTEMSWITVFRFHPINKLTTVVIDYSFLLILGLPVYAIVANFAVRHYYGAFIHADLPWSYGPFRYVFVSPVMHRWHHSTNPDAFNTNFASIFSFFDYVFGTYRVPRTFGGTLGIAGQTSVIKLISQLTYPLKPSSYSGLLQNWQTRRLAFTWHVKPK